MKSITDNFLMKLKQITRLSSIINKNDNSKILDMIKEHIIEIEELFNHKNEHWSIETADLIILCYELLLLENKNIDEIFNKCLPRFDKKLNRLVKDV